MLAAREPSKGGSGFDRESRVGLSCRPFLCPARFGRPVGNLSGADRTRDAASRRTGGSGGNIAPPETDFDRRCADRDGRRLDRPFRGLPGPAQPVARAGQGRGALSPRRHAGRSHGAGRLDDDQERGGQSALRRRQGRRAARPEKTVEKGNRAGHPALHQRDRPDHRAAAGHSGAGCQYRRPDHGLDDGHLRHEHRARQHRRRHRQAG